MTIGLENVCQVYVPHEVVENTLEHLRHCGRGFVEGVVLWAGSANHDAPAIFEVKALIVPKQMPFASECGVGVMVDGDELFRINVWLHRNKMTLIAQVHSHPDAAYHSQTDDDLAIVTRAGGFSIVVPDFGIAQFEFGSVVAYRLDTHGRWSEVAAKEAQRIFLFIGE